MGSASSQQSSPALNRNRNTDRVEFEFGSQRSISQTASVPSFGANSTGGQLEHKTVLSVSAQSDHNDDGKVASDAEQTQNVHDGSASEKSQTEQEPSMGKETTGDNTELQSKTDNQSANDQSDQIQDSSVNAQSDLTADDNSAADNNLATDDNPAPDGNLLPGSAQSNELAVKMLKDSPHLQKEFDHIDDFVKEMINDPLLEKGLYSDPSALAHFDFRNESETDRKRLGDYFSLTEGVFLMSALYKNLLASLGISNMVAITESMTDENTECVQKLSRLRMIVWYNTTFSLAFVEVVCRSGMLEHFVKDLEILKVSDVNTERTDLKYILESAIYILYNCSRNPSTRQQLRSYNTVHTLLPFLKCRSKVVKLQTLFALANLVTEEENQVLLADSSIFDVLFDILKSAWQQQTHHYVGWTVEELVAGMTGLAKNESNKTVLSEKEAVPILIEVMKDGSEKEQEHAVKCIWELSFDAKNKQAFVKNTDLMNLLKFLKTPTEKARAAEGALFTIEEITRQPTSPTATNTEMRSGGIISSGKATVMISYHWSDQQIALKIRDSLSLDGHKVLADIDNMSKSLMETMAENVEASDVILVVMSEKYKSSANCRIEAEYARFQLKKTILPLLVQADYRPDGWLGLFLGNLVYVDFTGRRPFEESIKKLKMSVEMAAKTRTE